MTRRARVVAGMSPGQLDQVARSLGFPSAQSLEGMLQIAAKLQRHAVLDQTDTQRLCQAYPAIDRAFLARYVEQINKLPSSERAARFIEIAAGTEHAEMAHGMVEQFSLHNDAHDLDTRLGVHDVAHTEHKQDPNSVRALVERQVPRDGADAIARRFNNANDSDRKALTADVLTMVAHRRGQLDDNASLRDQVRAALYESEADSMYDAVMSDSTEDLSEYAGVSE